MLYNRYNTGALAVPYKQKGDRKDGTCFIPDFSRSGFLSAGAQGERVR